MGYHFTANQLRVFRKFAIQDRNASFLTNTRLIVIEHILPTTEEFLNILLDIGVTFHKVFAKPYSIDHTVYDRLVKRIPLVTHPYKELEESTILYDTIVEAIEKSKIDKKKILLVDVGGYFAANLSKLSKDESTYITGVVEDTTFGHNRYLEKIKLFDIPVFSVARSHLKEIEARFVGRDAVYAMDTVLRQVGITIAGRNALVIGYGMIGKNVARTLKSTDLNVSVYDKHDHKNLAAFIDGYHIHKKRELLKSADIIFFATGDPNGALSIDEIEECKNNVILASVGSKDTEYDLKSLERQAKISNIGTYLKACDLQNSKRIISAKDGTAVNFLLPSIPIEVLDLVFSEILLCMMLLLKKGQQYCNNTLHESPSTFINEISKDWLRFVNS